MSWANAVDNPTGIRSVYGGDPPSLEGVSVHKVTLAREGPNVRLQLELAQYPSNPPAKWVAQGFNRVAIELLLVGVEELSVTGISTRMVADIVLHRRDDGLVVVDVESEHMRLNAIAASVAIGELAGYLVLD